MISPIKVFFTGEEQIGWALDSVQESVRHVVDFVQNSGLDDCDVIHSVYWGALSHLPIEKLVGKRVICHLANDPLDCWNRSSFRQVIPIVGRWVAESARAYRILTEWGLPVYYAPYVVDTDIFFPIAEQDPRLLEVLTRWSIPRDKYLIGSFQRDTEGSDLASPKLVKGPDIFFNIVSQLHVIRPDIHVILAGPRRFWIRHRLEEADIPFTFIGQIMAKDDLAINTLSQTEINLLYNFLDLYIVSSRMEGGPQAIHEVAAARCKIISTPVGQAEDILHEDCIYQHPLESVQVVRMDMEQDFLCHTIETNYRSAQNHSIEAVRPYYQHLYTNITRIPPVGISDIEMIGKSLEIPSRNWQRFFIRLNRKLNRVEMRPTIRVSLIHRFKKPPYGGGNQFMLALEKGLKRLGVKVERNKIHAGINAYVLNSVWFDEEVVKKIKHDHPKVKIIHRIDGPIALARGKDKELDDRCFQLNQQLADVTVYQSWWTYNKLLELGYHGVNPYVVYNAIDPDIFHPRGRITFSHQRKVRLISTSWSDNMRKGFSTYHWLDEHLDSNKFEYTFVGRSPIGFKNIRYIPPVPSSRLSNILRQHDIFIFASRIESCSNALLEALSCGLPVIYYNGSSNPELVGYGGAPFVEEEEILHQLDTLVENYSFFQNLISVPTLNQVSTQFLQLIEGDV